MNVTLSELKDIVDIIESITTIIAVIIGSIWGYYVFVRKRQRYPSAVIKYDIVKSKLTEDNTLLTVMIEIENIGETLVSLRTGEVRIQQVMPPNASLLRAIRQAADPIHAGETEFAWPILQSRTTQWKTGELEIEPGESHQISYDFVLSTEVQKAKIYCWFQNQIKRNHEIGWSKISIYDLSE
jgi:hypothetical protein